MVWGHVHDQDRRDPAPPPLAPVADGQAVRRRPRGGHDGLPRRRGGRRRTARPGAPALELHLPAADQDRLRGRRASPWTCWRAGPRSTRPSSACRGGTRRSSSACDLIRNMGALGIPVWCYEWMPVINWMRTSTTVPSRGGALATGFDHALMRNAPLTEYGEVSEDTLWENLRYFLEARRAGGREGQRQAGDAPGRPAALPHPRPGADHAQPGQLPAPDRPGAQPGQRDHPLPGQLHPDDRRPARRPSATSASRARSSSSTSATCGARRRSSSRPSTTKARRTCGPAWRPTATSASTASAARTTCRRWRATTTTTPAYSSIGRLFAIGYLKGLREAVYGERGEPGQGPGTQIPERPAP